MLSSRLPRAFAPASAASLTGSRPHMADNGWRTRQAAAGRSVSGYSNAREEETVQRLAEQGRYLTVEEGHSARARAKAIGEQVKSAFNQSGRELRFAVLPVTEPRDVDGRDHDERCVAPQRLFQADPVHLVSHVARASRGGHVRPAV